MGQYKEGDKVRLTQTYRLMAKGKVGTVKAVRDNVLLVLFIGIPDAVVVEKSVLESVKEG